MKTIFKTLFILTLLSTSISMFSQDTLLVENFGTPVGQVPITTFTGWQNTSVLYSGTAYLRNLATGSGCSKFTTAGNVLLNTSQYFQISGVKLRSDSSLTISFFMYNRSATATEDSLKFYISSDNINWKETKLVNFPVYSGWDFQEINFKPDNDKIIYFKMNNLSKKCLFWIDYLVVAQGENRSASVTAKANNATHTNENIRIISTKNGVCSFESSKNEDLWVYSVSGGLVSKTAIQEGENEISLTAGVYIFKTKTETKKVMIFN